MRKDFEEALDDLLALYADLPLQEIVDALDFRLTGLNEELENQDED